MSVKTLHAVAYVDRFAKDADDSWEPVAWGQLPIPAAKTEGEFLDAILGQVDNFTCDGSGDGTKGCTETHAAARERVRLRAMPNGKLAIVWRRYHPLIHKDQAQVGKPLEAIDEKNGTRIRIEVREIDYDGNGVHTDAAISEDQVATLEAELTKQQQAAAQKVAADEQLRAWIQATVEPAKATIEQAAADFQDLPNGGGIDGLKQRLDAVPGFLQDALQRSFGADDDGSEDGLLKPWRAACGGALQFDPAIATAQQEVNDILAAVEQTRQQQAALIDFQGQVRELVEKVDDYTQRRGEVIALQDDGAEPPDLAPLAKELAKIQGDAQKASTDDLAGLQQKLADFNGRAQGVFTQLEAAFEQTEALREALRGRIDRIGEYRDQSKLAEWHTIIEQGQGYPGFGVAHFKGEAEAKMKALADKLGDTEKALDLENPKLKSELGRLEKIIDQDEGAFFAEVHEAMAPRAQSVFRSVEAGGVSFQLPFASVRIGDDEQLRVEARNQHDGPVSLDFVDGAGQTTRLDLRTKGEVVAKALAGEAPFTFRVVAVAGEAAPEGQAQIAGQTVNVESNPIFITHPGAHQFAAPRGYRVRPAVAKAANLSLADDPQATYRQETIPGVEGAAK